MNIFTFGQVEVTYYYGLIAPPPPKGQPRELNQHGTWANSINYQTILSIAIIVFFSLLYKKKHKTLKFEHLIITFAVTFH